MAAQHNRSLDGVRGLACLHVLMAHFVSAFLPYLRYGEAPGLFTATPVDTPFYKALSFPLFTFCYNAHFSVLVALILSGYVLALPFYSGDAAVLKARALGRYIRLNFPIVAAVMLSYAVYQLGLYSNAEASAVSGSLWLKVFFAPGKTFFDAVHSALYASIFSGDGTFLPPLWILKINFVGSMLVLLWYAFMPQGRSALLGALACVFLVIFFKTESIFYLAIYAGSILGRFKFDRKYFYLLLLLAVFFGGFNPSYRIYDALPNLSYGDYVLFQKKPFYSAVGALLLVCAVLSGRADRVLASRPVQFFGNISYSLFLLHFIVLCSIATFVYTLVGPGTIKLLLVLVAYLSCSTLAAYVFMLLVDRPSMRLSRAFSKGLLSRTAA